MLKTVNYSALYQASVVMSLIHLDKSVVTFHFKEILEDGHVGGPLTMLGLGVLLFGPKLLSNMVETLHQPSQRRLKSQSPYRPHISLTEWVAQAQQQQFAAATPQSQGSVTRLEQAAIDDRLAA